LWQFPVVLKFRVPTSPLKPFVEAGPSVQIATNITETSTTVLQPTPFGSHPDAPGDVAGIVLGGGIDLRVGHFLISPQARYQNF
jgi:hypothetical protein